METRFPIIRPGFFGNTLVADSRRIEFDAHNEALVYHRMPVDFVFIGDSITHMWDLQTYFGRSGLVLVNRGVGGDRSYFLEKRFSADVVQLRPTYAVILIGINNTWVMDEWIASDRKSADEIRWQLLADVQAVIRMSKDNGIIPIICSILPVCMDINANTPVRNELVLAANEQLKQITAEEHAIYVDYHIHFIEEDGKTLAAGLAFDGIHPNVYGYNKMAEILRQTLKQYDILI